jgi:Leucine-rich repeat (LRR) protein
MSKLILLFSPIFVITACLISKTQQRSFDQQRDILIELYKSTNGTGWNQNTEWLSDADVCQWYGVKCNAQDQIVQLELNNNQLSGTIPSSLGQLNNLQILYLYNNQLSGTILSSLGQLNNLKYLHLSDNQLSETIPSSLEQLNIQYLNIDNNQLSGTIPSSLGQLKNLGVLYLDNNQLSGTIPSSLGQLNNLKYLHLSNNQLSGTILSSLGQLNNLQYLYLDNNQLQYINNETLALPRKLKSCDMSDNKFKCPIPYWTEKNCGAVCN